MWLNELKKYLGFFLLGVLLIVVYKTFDNFGYVLDFGREVLSLLTPFVIGACIAYVLYLPCRKLEALCLKTGSSFLHRHRCGIAIAAIYVLFLLAVVLLLVAVVPALVQSVSDFIVQLPSLIQELFAWLNSFGFHEFNASGVIRFFNENLLSWDKLLGSFTYDNVSRYTRGVMNVGTTLFHGFMGIVISIYILIDRHSLKNTFLRLFSSLGSPKLQTTLLHYLKKTNEFLRAYLSCQLLDALIVFILSFLTLSILRTKYALLLALIVGSFNLIPYFGAIVATVLSALVTAFTKDFTAGIIVAIALIVLQQIDANLIQPRLLSDSLDVRPFWVIFGIILGGGLFGVFGFFLAVPLMALLRNILTDILERKTSATEALPSSEPK